MRCVCCDRNLSDRESTTRYKSTGDYTDMCSVCLTSIGDDIETVSRTDLESVEEGEVEYEFEEENEDGV